MYSILIEGGETIKKAKGIKSTVVKTSITFEDYRKCLEDLVILQRSQCNIRSKLHIVHTEKQNKIALSPHDNKRFLLPHTTETLPWGHYRIIDEQMAQAALKVEGEMLMERENVIEEQIAQAALQVEGEMLMENNIEEQMAQAVLRVEGEMLMERENNIEEQMAQAVLRVEREMERGDENILANQEREERGYEASNENGFTQVGMTLHSYKAEAIIVVPNVTQEMTFEWDSPMERVSPMRGDILQEAMEGAAIVVGNCLYEEMHETEELIRAIEGLEKYQPCRKKPRLI